MIYILHQIAAVLSGACFGIHLIHSPWWCLIDAFNTILFSSFALEAARAKSLPTDDLTRKNYE